MNINQIFQIAIANRASDVHLVHGLAPVIRIDGDLFTLDESHNLAPLAAREDLTIVEKKAKNTNSIKEFSNAPKKGAFVYVDDLLGGKENERIVSSGSIHKLIKEILNEEQLERFYKEKDYDISHQFDGARFRINLSYERGHFKMVARIIPEKNPTLEEIDMPEKVKDLLNAKQGLILLTGPTGCGKSTSLAAMIDYINNNLSCNVVTLEDPIEFLFKSNKSVITQRQLGTDMPNFSSGLKHVLRQDPNVIMVGEMRDLETISTAITLAETGHLVLATLHTCNAAQTIDRIIDVFPPYQQNQIKSQLSLVLSAVISQVLVPKVSGGRTAIRELLINNPAIANLIREQKINQIKNVINTHSSEGMISFERSVKDLYERQIISSETAQHFLNNNLALN